MTALDVEVGRDYIVYLPKEQGVPLGGLRVARVDGKAKDGDVLIRLRMGPSIQVIGITGRDGDRHRYSKKLRRLSVTHVRRLATPREVAVAMPIHEVPGPS